MIAMCGWEVMVDGVERWWGGVMTVDVGRRRHDVLEVVCRTSNRPSCVWQI